VTSGGFHKSESKQAIKRGLDDDREGTLAHHGHVTTVGTFFADNSKAAQSAAPESERDWREKNGHELSEIWMGNCYAHAARKMDANASGGFLKTQLSQVAKARLIRVRERLTQVSRRSVRDLAIKLLYKENVSSKRTVLREFLTREKAEYFKEGEQGKSHWAACDKDPGKIKTDQASEGHFRQIKKSLGHTVEALQTAIPKLIQVLYIMSLRTKAKLELESEGFALEPEVPLPDMYEGQRMFEHKKSARALMVSKPRIQPFFVPSERYLEELEAKTNTDGLGFKEVQALVVGRVEEYMVLIDAQGRNAEEEVDLERGRTFDSVLSLVEDIYCLVLMDKSTSRTSTHPYAHP